MTPVASQGWAGGEGMGFNPRPMICLPNPHLCPCASRTSWVGLSYMGCLRVTRYAHKVTLRYTGRAKRPSSGAGTMWIALLMLRNRNVDGQGDSLFVKIFAGCALLFVLGTMAYVLVLT